MQQRTLSLVCVATLIAAAMACSDKSESPAAPTPPTSSGSDLKATAPSPQSPVNDQKVSSTPVTLTAGTATLQYASGGALQYRFQVLNGNAVVATSGLMNSPTWTVSSTLVGSQRHTWQVRAEYQGSAGPWSSAASFISPDPALISDALTDGRTVGIQRGGHFIPGQGWMSDSLTDGIDYDIKTCSNCTVEFDATNFGRKEGEGVQKDLKWITMGDAGAFGDFGSFRDHPWKMHLEQRADGDGTGMKLIWRNGAAGGGEPGDHTGRVDSGVDWRNDQVYHFKLTWNPSGFQVSVNGQVWFQDGFGGNAYAPPNHRVSLGCYPRAESFVGSTIFRNVKITENR
jgi:hypothetical protein